MNIKPKIIVIMITCFALISCMTILSAADVPNDNSTQVIHADSTHNEPVIAKNTEIKTIDTNNIQRNNQKDNKNNEKFENQQSKFNSMEKSLPENKNQPETQTNTNRTQSMTKMPQQDQNNSPTNITPKLNENTSPEIQQPGINKIPENQQQPMNINENSFNNNTKLQEPQNIKNTISRPMSNMTSQFKDNMADFEKNTSNKNEPKNNDMKQPTNNKNNMTFDLNKNQKPEEPQKDFNKNIPQTTFNPSNNNDQKSNMGKNKFNQKQDFSEYNFMNPMKNTKPTEPNTPNNPIDNTKPTEPNTPNNPMNNTKPTEMDNFMPSNNNIPNSQSNDVSYSTDVDVQLLVSGTTISKDNTSYSVTDSESNTVLVQNGGSLTLSNSKVTKTGDTTNSGNSEFLGTNAAILTTYGSTAYIMNSTIVTDAAGANAVFATNTDSSHSGATIYINDTTIDTYQDKSRGLDATYGGTIIADNVTINTRGGSCAALATDRGEGTVTVSNSVLNTGVDNGTGQGSPCIYSTGKITVINSTGTAYGAQIACIEGKNSITLTNSTLYCSGEGNRQENGNYIDLAGIFIYQSMSGDADVGTAVFTSTDSNLTILSTSDYYTTAPMFYVTNTKGIVTITNTTLNYGSGVLIKVSNQNQWGTTGSNGGDLTFNAVNENLNGNIIVGDYSSLSLDLRNSTYKGAITTSSSATSSVTIESGSTWTLTGDSYLSSLTNYGSIICGNYKLYVNGVEYTI